MKNKGKFGIEGRTWLTASYKSAVRKFSYPPVKGTHQECFQAINKDSELRPAEGLDLALLTERAYAGKEDEWRSVRQDCFVNNYTRIPVRNLWVPKSYIKEDNDLTGVLIERDTKGNGLSNKMQIPEDFSGWKQAQGSYFSPDGNMIFIPSDKYKLGEHDKNSFAKDGYAQAILTPEGAEIFARIAHDAKKKLWTWGYNVNEISQPEQRVSLLDGDGARLGLGGYDWVGSGDSRAFGVCKETGEASVQGIK